LVKMRAKKIDANQAEIVKTLREIPGVTVEVGHDDILVGYRGRTLWYEVKDPKHVGKDGTIRQSAIKDSQKKLIKEWQGFYRIVWHVAQILKDLNEITHEK